MNSPSEIRGSEGAAALRVALAAALAAGVVDVAMALLQKPQDFANFGALAAPILAVAVAFLAVYAIVWAAARPVVLRRLQLSSWSAALGAALFTGFMLVRLAGLQFDRLTPHLAFRLAMIGVMTVLVGIGTYATSELLGKRPGWQRYSAATTLAAPLLLFEVLLFEWFEVYAIDSVASLSSLLATGGLALAAGLTMAAFLSVRGTTAMMRAVQTFVALLVIVAIVRSDTAGRTVAARGSAHAANVPARIILITVDTLRADAVSAYNRSASRTPAIDRLAGDGVLFENAISPAPWTLPSLASVLTGLLPAVHAVTGLDSRLSDRVTTLPERLRARGYLTAAIVHNPLLPPERNLNQGFTQYLDLHEPAFGDSTGARLLQTSWPSRFPSAAWPSPAEQTDLVLSWLRSNRANSFFLWVHFFDPHAPYTPTREDVIGQPPAGLGFRFDGQNRNTPLYLVPAADQRRWIRELYDAEARRVDANIGRLLQALRDQQLYDGSLIVLTSDHGEEFWEHGAQGHGQSLYGELLDVPLIIKVPGASVSRRVTTPVSTVSVTPTILDLAGVGYAADDLSARSLSPMLNPDAPAPAALPILSNYILTSGVFVDRRDAVTFGGMKYLTGPLERHRELFDISSDPGEQHPLDASSPDRLADLQRRLAEQLAAATALRKRLQIEEGSVDIDADTARRLRTLGYLK